VSAFKEGSDVKRTRAILVVAGLLLTLAALGSAAITAMAPRRSLSRAGRWERRLSTRLRLHGKVELGPYTLFAREVDGTRLANPVVKRKDGRGEIDLVTSAREGSFHVEVGEQQVLRLHLRFGDSLAADGSRAWFEERVAELPLPADLDP
jgi:hypothetical protein